MTDRLPAIVRAELVLEQRVPDTHSATREEHAWHVPSGRQPVDVTGLTAHAVLEAAAKLHADVPVRRDYEIRVILRSVTIERWVVA